MGTLASAVEMQSYPFQVEKQYILFIISAITCFYLEALC